MLQSFCFPLTSDERETARAALKAAREELTRPDDD